MRAGTTVTRGVHAALSSDRNGDCGSGNCDSRGPTGGAIAARILSRIGRFHGITATAMSGSGSTAVASSRTVLATVASWTVSATVPALGRVAWRW